MVCLMSMSRSGPVFSACSEGSKLQATTMGPSFNAKRSMLRAKARVQGQQFEEDSTEDPTYCNCLHIWRPESSIGPASAGLGLPGEALHPPRRQAEQVQHLSDELGTRTPQPNRGCWRPGVRVSAISLVLKYEYNSAPTGFTHSRCSNM